MKVVLILILITPALSFSQGFTKRHLERLKDKKDITYDDLAHENPGCPENSECSVSNGLKIKSWIKMLKRYQRNQKVLSLKIEEFRKKNGIPTAFLTKENKAVKQSIDPIIFDSRCSHHKQKDKPKIVKGIKFLRNNPKSDKMIFTKVKTKNAEYEIPYGDQALFFWKNSLIVISSYDDYIYELSITKDGKWKAINIPPKLLKKARVSKSDISCKQKSKGNEFFLGSYCMRLWDEDKKDYQVVEQSWACP